MFGRVSLRDDCEPPRVPGALGAHLWGESSPADSRQLRDACVRSILVCTTPACITCRRLLASCRCSGILETPLALDWCGGLLCGLLQSDR